MFAIGTLIQFVIAYLATTIKNPGSTDAIRVRAIVERLHSATGDFLKQVY
jgi:hypothetical protein